LIRKSRLVINWGTKIGGYVGRRPVDRKKCHFQLIVAVFKFVTGKDAASMKKVWHYQPVADGLRKSLIFTRYRNYFFLSSFFPLHEN
jgi:hypothetical protein